MSNSHIKYLKKQSIHCEGVLKYQFNIESRWPKFAEIKQVSVYWIKDISCDYTMCVRVDNGKYSFIGMREEEAERMVKKYECEQFFYEEDSNLNTLLEFAISILQSST